MLIHARYPGLGLTNSRHVLAVRFDGLALPRDILQCKFEFPGWQVAVQSECCLCLLIEEQECRSELHPEGGCKLFFRELMTVYADDIFVAPHVDTDDIKLLTREFHDVFLREVFLDQRVAIRATVLVEDHHDTLAVGRRFLNILAKLEKTLEPVRVDGCHGTNKLAMSRLT